MFLQVLKALEVSFPEKKESLKLEFIWSLKSGLNSSLSSFASKLLGLDY